MTAAATTTRQRRDATSSGEAAATHSALATGSSSSANSLAPQQQAATSGSCSLIASAMLLPLRNLSKIPPTQIIFLYALSFGATMAFYILGLAERAFVAMFQKQSSVVRQAASSEGIDGENSHPCAKPKRSISNLHSRRTGSSQATMKICAACVQELPQTNFSKKQWQLKKYRRCKECIDVNQALQLTVPQNTESPEIPSQSSPSTEDEGTACCICLEEGPDEFGQPLRRDCACRGDSAGFAHLSCIVRYAQAKSRSVARPGAEFIKAWEFCFICKQRYQNELALDLANEFVTFTKVEYPDDQYMHIQALVWKLGLIPIQAHLEPNETKKDELWDEVEQLEVRLNTMVQQM